MPAALTIGFVPGVSPAKWVRVWRERFPALDIALMPIEPGRVDDALRGEADLVFARLPVGDDYHAIPLWVETPVAAMPKDSDYAAAEELSISDLEDASILADATGSRSGIVSTVPDDLDGLLDLVEAGAGLAIIPQSLFRAASRRALVSRPVRDLAPTQVALVWRPEDHSEAVDAFIGIVRGRTANSSRGEGALGNDDRSPRDGGESRGKSGGGRGTGSGARGTSGGARGSRRGSRGRGGASRPRR